MSVRGSHEHCIAAELFALQKLPLYQDSVVLQILPFPLNWAENDFRSKSRLLWQSVRFKGRRLNVLEYNVSNIMFMML